MVEVWALNYLGLQIQYFCDDFKEGKGVAIHTGVGIATGDYMLIQGADVGFDPVEDNTLLEPQSMGLPMLWVATLTAPFFLAYHW